jgi:hypothetical protein
MDNEPFLTQTLKWYRTNKKPKPLTHVLIITSGNNFIISALWTGHQFSMGNFDFPENNIRYWADASVT